MKIVYHSKPFYHVIVYDMFGDEEYKDLQKEIDYVMSQSETVELDDKHHNDIAMSNIRTWQLDKIFFNRRNASKLLNSTGRAFQIPFDRNKFPFVDLLPITNSDTSFLHGYENDSFYFKHKDESFLTFLFNFWKDSKFEGGEIEFTDYGYKPDLKANSLIVFPGNVEHHVNLLTQKSKKIDRIILNRRCWINM